MTEPPLEDTRVEALVRDVAARVIALDSTGSVTLHFTPGRIRKLEWRLMDEVEVEPAALATVVLESRRKGG